MTRNELWQHIQKCEKLHERKKLKRFIYTVLFYAAVYMVIFYFLDWFDGADILLILAAIVISIIASVITCFLNATVFWQLFKMSQDEKAAIDYLKKRLREKEQEDKY